MENNEDILRDVSTDFNVIPEDLGDVREGVTKFSVDDILGKKAETATTIDEPEKGAKQGAESPTQAPSEGEKSQKEVFAEVKAMAYGFNFLVVALSGTIANIAGKKIDTNNISASDQELTRLAKVAQPVYEKYAGKMSPEALLITTIASLYGFRIAGEFLGASELASKTTKETTKETFKGESWEGNPNYFQTGKKAGQLKPSKK